MPTEDRLMRSQILDDLELRELLTNTKVIAVVGHSAQSNRPSYQVAQFLRSVGYTVYPVNPSVTTIDDQPSYQSLADLPEPVDLVNVFRRSQYLKAIVAEAIAINAKVIWSQLGIVDSLAAQIGRDAGLTVVMDSCIKVEYSRLFC